MTTLTHEGETELGKYSLVQDPCRMPGQSITKVRINQHAFAVTYGCSRWNDRSTGRDVILSSPLLEPPPVNSSKRRITGNFENGQVVRFTGKHGGRKEIHLHNDDYTVHRIHRIIDDGRLSSGDR